MKMINPSKENLKLTGGSETSWTCFVYLGRNGAAKGKELLNIQVLAALAGLINAAESTIHHVHSG